MPTRRTPRRWEAKRVITPAAIEAFERLRAARNKEEWWEAHSALHDELRGRPWEWPIVENPREPCPYPPGSYAARHWQEQHRANPAPIELWRELQRAAKTARAATGEQSEHAAEPTPRRTR
jgi:hypothetical protein